MLEIGSTVIYGSKICRLDEIKDIRLGKVTRDYYVLTPIGDDKNVIYVPTDNEALRDKMKRVLSADEIYALVESIKDCEDVWIEDERERNAEYKRIIEAADRREMVKIIKTLFEKRQELEAMGRKLHSHDLQLFERAERLIYEEFALVLDIKKEEVVPFIASQIEVSRNKV